MVDPACLQCMFYLRTPVASTEGIVIILQQTSVILVPPSQILVGRSLLNIVLSAPINISDLTFRDIQYRSGTYYSRFNSFNSAWLSIKLFNRSS